LLGVVDGVEVPYTCREIRRYVYVHMMVVNEEALHFVNDFTYEMLIELIFQMFRISRLVEPFEKFTPDSVLFSNAQDAVIYYYFVGDLERVMYDPANQAI
jgi:hypothetical protein